MVGAATAPGAQDGGPAWAPVPCGRSLSATAIATGGWRKMSPRARQPHRVATAGAVLGLLTGAPPAAGDQRIATEAAATGVSAHAGRVVWSSYRPTTKRYRLMTRFRGRTTAVAAKSRRVPFDADLGPDPRGRTVAVYSRCSREPSSAGSGPLPSYTTGRGCDLFQFDFASRRERRISGPSRPGSSETLPSIWRGRLAFARVFERRPGVRGVLPHLYVRHGHSTRAIPGGTRGAYQCTRDGCEGGPGAVSLELRGHLVAFVWELQPTRCGNVTEEQGVGGLDASELWLYGPQGSSRRLLGSCSGHFGQYFSPSFAGQELYSAALVRRRATVGPSGSGGSVCRPASCTRPAPRT